MAFCISQTAQWQKYRSNITSIALLWMTTHKSSKIISLSVLQLFHDLPLTPYLQTSLWTLSMMTTYHFLKDSDGCKTDWLAIWGDTGLSTKYLFMTFINTTNYITCILPIEELWYVSPWSQRAGHDWEILGISTIVPEIVFALLDGWRWLADLKRLIKDTVL